MKEWTMILLGLSIILIAITNIMQTNDIKETREALVYSVCNQARQEINGASEQDCGELQDKFNIKFSCENRNSLASNKCWTEDK